MPPTIPSESINTQSSLVVSRLPVSQIRRDITVVNPGFPMMKALGRSFAASGRLASYTVGYNYDPGSPLGSVEKAATVGARMAAELKRRSIPIGVPAELTKNAATAEELASAFIARMPGGASRISKPLSFHLMWRRNRKIGQWVARQPEVSSVLLGSYGTILEALESPRWRNSLRLVDYPIAHHDYTEHLLEEERLRDPLFAGLAPETSLPPEIIERLDREIAAADRILVGSDFVARSFIEQGVPSEKLWTIPYGIDTRLFSPSQRDIRKNTPFRLLFVGTVCQRKGVRYLLEACSLLPRGSAHLQLVGGAPHGTAPLEPYRDLYEHIPYTSQQTLAEIYRNASVFVFPSLVEGLGLVVLEAMASGLPVIVTDRGPDQVVRDGIDGFIVPANDARAIADRIELLMSDDALRCRMGQAARERALSFSIEHYVNDVTALIDRLLAERGLSRALPSTTS